MTVSKDERLAVRVTAQQKRAIERAAQALGRNVTEFSVEALTERAEEVLSERPVFDISYEAWKQFQIQLDAPVAPPAELVDLLRRRPVFDE